MCGINFILDKKAVLDYQPIERMTHSTKYRGPDHSKTYHVESRGSNYFFGCNRLRIMDLSERGDQPFISEDGNSILLYNGEIYNFYELKNELLRKGYRFKSASDTEVLFYLLIEEGEAALKKLKGMFAFVFFNISNNSILAARDHSGMKPLFYSENDRFLIISSECKAILSSGLIDKELNEEQIPYYLKYRFARKPFTFFKNVYELIEGHFLKATAEGKANIQSYGQANPQPIEPIHDAELVDRTEELLYDALLRHTVSDAPSGLFLSGGVDSTLALALLRKGNIHLPTFSVVYEDRAGSFRTMDNRYSRKAAQRYGNSIDHYEIEADHELMDRLDDFIEKLDQPIGDSALLLTDILSAYAANTVKTVLSGAGADELFAGYNRHWAFFQYLKYGRRFNAANPVMKKLAFLLPTGFNHPFRKKFNLIRKFAAGLHEDPAQTFINFTALHMPVDNVFSESSEFSTQNYFQDALRYDRTHYLVSDVLAVNDRMSMRHGIEMRMPYLDRDVVDFVDAVDGSRLIKPGRKWILKKILQRMGGGEFIRRPKEGFGAPFGHWLRLEELKSLEYEFTREHDLVKKYVNPAAIHKLYLDHIRRRADNSLELWNYLVLVKWLDQAFSK